MHFDYDALGNRTSKGGTNYQYDPTTLRQTQSTGIESDFSITYDANGNRTGDNQGQYIYRPDNLMRRSEPGSGAWREYIYDGDGQRWASWTQTTNDVTIHGAGGLVLSEFSGGCCLAWTRDSIYAGSQLIATIEPAPTPPPTLEQLLGTWWGLCEDGVWRSDSITQEADGSLTFVNEVGEATYGGSWDPDTRTMTAGPEWGYLVNDITANVNRLLWRNNTVWVRTTNAVPDDIVIKFFHTDALGSVRAVTDMAGQPTARYDYGAFGEGPGVSAATEKQRFAGTERDAETFLDYMGARYYRNVNGRFNSPDPGHANANITRPQSWNAYAYASNNPLRFVDPTGLSDSPIGGGEKDFGRDLIVADSGMGAGASEFESWIDWYKNAPTSVDFSDYAMYLSNPEGFLAWQQDQQRRINADMNISESGLRFLEMREGRPGGGPALTVYNDTNGIPTIGFGHVVQPDENFSRGITADQASRLLLNDASDAVDFVRRLSRVSLTQWQFDALVSVAFNSRRAADALLHDINQGRAPDFVGSLLPGSNQGLINRRQLEASLYNTGNYGVIRR